MSSTDEILKKVKKDSSTRHVWENMKQRCLNPKHPSYPRYGGRGISICSAWLEFYGFYADVGDKPEGLSLDRYPDKDGNYEPGNWRWASSFEQNNNLTSNVLLEFNGEKKSISQWAHQYGLKVPTVYSRLTLLGWDVEEALTTPVESLIKFDGREKTISQWAREIGLHGSTLYHRIKTLGWSVERALTTPAKTMKGAS